MIVAVHKDGDLWYYWQAIGAGGWNPEQVAGPALGEATTRKASVAQVGDWSVIACVDSLGNLSVWWQYIDATGWLQRSVETAGDIRD